MKRLLLSLLPCILPFALAIGQSGTGDYSVTITGDSVEVLHSGFESTCGSYYVPSATLSNDTVTIVERDTSIAYMTCDCSYSVATYLVGLAPSTYQVLVYHSQKVLVCDQGTVYSTHDTTWFLKALSFTIVATPQTASSIFTRAMNCGESSGEAVDSRTLSPDSDFLLSVNYPNPFNPETHLHFTLPHRATIRLTVLDILGREVSVLFEGDTLPGEHDVVFNGSTLASGTYFCHLQFPGHNEVRRMVLVK